MNSIQELVNQLQILHEELNNLEKRKRIRNILKVIGVGFLLYRDVDQEISKVQTKISDLAGQGNSAAEELLEQIKFEVEKISNSQTMLQKSEEEKWLSLLKTFESNARYLRSVNALEEQQSSKLLEESSRYQKFITEHNEQIRKNELKQELLKLKKEILQAAHELCSLFDSQNYFTKKQLQTWKNKWSQLIEVLNESTRLGVEDLDFSSDIAKIVEAYQIGDQLIETRNKHFVEEEMERYKELFDEVESNPLTLEQRRAVVVDEESNLVVAGAGTGKTSTIIAKAVYLINKGLAKPEEILLIAFNRDVVEEMKKRLSAKLEKTPEVKTFHALGLNIIAESTGEKPSVSELAEDKIKLPLKLRYFVNSHMQDEKSAKLVTEYFLYESVPYKSIFEFNSYGEYIDYIKKYDLRSLKGDKVKSLEECYIANYLYVNGINYLYENPYGEKTVSKVHRQYKPDFFLPEYGIYVEHFGVDRRGKTAPYVVQSEYNDQMTWKRNIHATNHTTLIETYSYERQEGQLLKNLKKKLREKEVVFNPMSAEGVFEKLESIGKIEPFSNLLANFLNLFKSCGNSIDEIKQQVDEKDTRTKVFLEIFSKVYDDYSAFLDDTGKIDFNDMINEAISLTKDKKYESGFKYVLVDEFQDISQSRYRLLKSLIDQNEAKLFCVGDDWQSIYRFAGSDLSIMVHFEEHFGFSETIFLQETFRFPDKLCDFSSKFILQNPLQIKKTIISRRKEENPVVTIIQNNPEQSVREIITKIAQESRGKESVFVIGRYGYLKPENLYKLQREFPELTIDFTTAHSSKGLQADYVILVGLTSGEYGFPCEIADDPVLNLVLADQDAFGNAEERRLFYVAVTRAKKHVYLVVDIRKNVSSFVSELQRGEYEINYFGEKARVSCCPVCKTGEIVQKHGKYSVFYSCNNYPYCEYIAQKCPECKNGFLEKKTIYYYCSEPDCQLRAEVCPSCDDGYLVRRRGRNGGYFYGCSNYPSCKHVKREFQRDRHYKRYVY
jgi:DNA helicase-4